jgi:hypothetical protein
MEIEQVQCQAAVILSSLLGVAVPFDFPIAASKDPDAEARTLAGIASALQRA